MPKPIDRTGGTAAELHDRSVAQQLLVLQRDVDRVRGWLMGMSPDASLDVYVELNADTCTLSFTRRQGPPA